MSDIVNENHYHDDTATPSRNNGVITAIVVVLFVLLALFFFSRSGGDSGAPETESTGESQIEVDGSTIGSTSGSVGQ